MAEDKEVCEEIFRIILEKPDLVVIVSKTQRFLRNIGSHSVILDFLCQDKTGAYFNIEVQKADDDDHQKCIRFNHSNMELTFQKLLNRVKYFKESQEEAIKTAINFMIFHPTIQKMTSHESDTLPEF